MTTAGDVIKALSLPPDSRVDQRVPKKLLVEIGAPTATDKKHINEGIEELLWIAALKPDTIGVPIFRDDGREYLEIAVLSLTLRPGAKVARLMELVHRAIPYPVFLIVTHPLGITVSLAHLRWSQGQAGQMVVDGHLAIAELDVASPASTDFLRSLSTMAQPRQDLQRFYQGWIERFEAYAAALITSSFRLCESLAAYESRRAALAERDRLLREIASLRARATKETQINRMVELNLEIKSLESLLTQTLSLL